MKSTQTYLFITLIVLISSAFAFYQFSDSRENTTETSDDYQIQNFELKEDLSEEPVEDDTPIENKIDRKLPKEPYFIDLDSKLHVTKLIESAIASGTIKIDYNLKDIELCGGTYKAKQVFIDGVDVAQRLSEIFKEDMETSDWWCDTTIKLANDTGGLIDTNEEIHITLLNEEERYIFQISLGVSLFDTLSGSLDYGFANMVLPKYNKILDTEGSLIGVLHK